MSDSLFKLSLLIAAGMAGLVLWAVVHLMLLRWYLFLARRYCHQRNLAIVGGKAGPAFDNLGIKTESTRFEFDCLDVSGHHATVTMDVWLFGVRRAAIAARDAAED